MSTQMKRPATRARRKGVEYYLRRDWILYLMLFIPITYYIVFKYLPMYGVTIAFKDYNMFKGILESPWVGLKYYRRLFRQNEFYRVVRNTLVLNVLDLAFSFPAPIILAYNYFRRIPVLSISSSDDWVETAFLFLRRTLIGLLPT